jgi:hypothetical protein
MKINCLTKKDAFKNLTINKEYDAVEDGEVFVVTNDSGFRSRYAKKYFRIIPEAAAPRNLLDLLTVAFDDDEQEVTITLNRTTRTVRLDINTSGISCGIDEIEGISALKRVVNELYAAKMADIIGSKSDMFKAILDTIFEVLRENDARMCYLLSDEIRVAEEQLDAVLTEMSEVSTTGTNPNNDHQIILWVIK